MKKIFIISAIFFSFSLTGFSADIKPVNGNQNSEIFELKEQKAKICKARLNFNLSTKSGIVIHKQIRKFNPIKNILLIKKQAIDNRDIIIAWILGFLFGLIGVLISFLIYLKHENRKEIMKMAWWGWLTGVSLVLLVILSL